MSTKRYVPAHIANWAKERDILPLVKKVAGWVEGVDKQVTGGTAIGKGYSTLILDIKHHGAEIYIDLDDEIVTLHGEEVTDLKSFKAVWAKNQKAAPVAA